MADYYIATTGNDSTGTGTLASPWLTLAHAYASSASGDTINVAAGTYTWLTATMTSRTIQGAGAATTIFDAGGASAAQFWYLNGITCNDLTFRNNGVTVTGTNAPSAEAKNNQIFRGYNGYTSTITFNRCIFHDIVVGGPQTDYGSGLFALGGYEGGSISATNLNLSTCLFYNISKLAALSYGAIMNSRNETPATGAGTVSVTSCTFALGATGSSALTAFATTQSGEVTALTLTNTIIYNSSGVPLSWGGTPIPTLSHCDAYQMTGTITDSGGNITGDPLFIDAAGFNFKLRPGSPCIATGTLV